MSLPSTIYASVAERVVFPAMSRVQSESARLRVAYARGLAMTAFVGLPLTAVLVIAAPQLIQVIFGPQWSGAIAPFMGLASSMYCRISWRVSSSLLRSRGRVDLVILTNASQATLVVGGCMLAYPHGLEAVAAAVSLSFLVGYVVVTTLACRNIGLTFAEYCATQVNGIALGCLVATLAFAGAALAGAWHLSNLTALLVIFATAGTGALVAIVVGPRVFVGPDVSPMAQIVRGLVRRNVKPRRRDLI
jgi:PST family polysaccharide transporter